MPKESTLKCSFGEGNVVQTPFAALAEIKEKLPKTNVGGNGNKLVEPEPKADIDGLVARKKATEDFDAEAVKAEAKKRSEQVFGSAADYFKICRRIAELQSVEGIELTAQFRELRELLSEQSRINDVLARQPKGVQDQFAVDLFITEIDNLEPRNPYDVLMMFNRTLAMGRGRVPDAEDKEFRRKNEKWSTDHVYFRNGDRHYVLLHIFSQMPGREGQVSGADKRIFKALRALVYRFVGFSREKAEKALAEEATRIADIRARHGLPLRLIADGKEGYYTLYLPPDEKRPNGWGEGAGIVQIVDLNKDKKGAFPFLVVRVEDGAGSLKSWREADRGKWVAVPTYRGYLKDKKISDSVPEEHQEFVLDVCRKIYVATGYALSRKE
ncbi:hypothetical protein KJ934_03045 [Patescibacteria group bacterium]|nr:hypothetical protein [Patescibacteria group bacterium]MBU4353248.1 hypothetical protein [Patescibacteria group bacterium]MBU4477144.1 hypothetical protein [Patescibacteria group bacterium]MCG2698927.1 hypothetical protein [Candidatus Parcubacteria bacterium]